MLSRISLPTAALGAGSLLLLGGCASTPPPPVDQSRFTAEQRLLIKSTPVLDIHTHTFNSRFLPLRGIALGKRDKLGVFSIFVSDAMTLALVHAITWATEKSKMPEEGDIDQHIAKRVNETLAMRNISAQDVRKDPGITGARKLLNQHKEVKDLDPAEKKSLDKFARFFEDHPGIFGDQTDHSNELRHFLSCLTAEHSRMESLFQNDHTAIGGKRREVAMEVSHMMDLAPTYDQREDGDELYRFRDQQIPLMQQQQRNAQGRMLYFVAYNPFRDTWTGDPKAGPGNALAIVREAYEKKGAFGVKVYPPSGYAPAGNSIPMRPWSIAYQPREQWRARYRPEGRPAVTNADLDRRLLELCVWAADHDVPLFAHCGQGEFEARVGYHKMADPKGWKKLLEDNKAQFPQLVKLRLCLGHAGGGKEWYGMPNPLKWGDGDWGHTVYELCRDYPNIYCEFGCHDDIADPEKRGRFTQHLKELIEDSRTPGKGYHDFSKKICYGSDWFMPLNQATDRLNYMLAFKSAVYDAGDTRAAEVYRDFCYRNALTFLNVNARIKKGGLPPALVANLRALME